MIKVYTKNNCQPCLATKRRMEKKGIEFVEINIDEQPELAQDLMSLGFIQSPVVVTEDASWSGYSPDKIDSLT